MNRNQLYEYLKDIGLYAIFRYRKHGYHVEFCEDAKKDLTIKRIVTDWGYIRGVERIHLCHREIVIETEYGFGKINIPYQNINKFEVEFVETTLL